MRRITLTGLGLTAFRSFVQPTRIDFATRAGLSLVTGDNLAEPRLGGNGAGKSSLWDAVTFALYGSSVRGLRAADLISYGHAGLEVSLTLAVDDDEHLIRRTAPPQRIHLDGELVEQADVERLIGLGKARFLNSVVFGQSTPLFIDLPVPARGDLLDEVLELELWMRAADRAAVQSRAKTTELTALRSRIARIEGQIEGLGDITRFDALEAAFKDDKERRIEAVLTRFAEHETRLAALTDDLAQDIELTDETAVRDRSRTFSASHHTAREWLATASAEHKMIYDTIQFLARHTTCPTCGQAITAEHSTAYAHAVRPRLAELAHTCEISKLDIATTEAEISGAEITLRQAVASNERKKSERAAQQREARHLTELLADLERQAVAIDAEENPHAAERCRVAAERARLDAARHTAQTAEAMLVSEVAALDFWRQGFRRVRLFCLERVLGELTIETRNSLLELGLRDWEITFTATTESKSGVVRLGVQTEMTGPNADCKFDMISGGEGQRARLATSLGFANLVQRHAGVVFNLEVFDEPTAWLSEQGVEDLLECLHARALAKNRAIYICDHRSLQHTGFSKILRIIKDDRGSRLAN